jgi:hypothetical protein
MHTMNFMLTFEPKKLPEVINYRDKIMLIGSCFTEHIGNALQDAKFSILQNPNGILFDPVSVCKSLVSYVENKQYTETDLFFLNEVWNNWQYHSRFSNAERSAALEEMNGSRQKAHDFLREASWVVITLGSSFSYRLTEAGGTYDATSGDRAGDRSVANCHRAPAQWFSKHMLSIAETTEALDHCLHRLFQFNPNLKFLFTVSPVRHIRDGLVENNRSKSRLIEAVHHMVNKYERLFYFPAYELVIDVLRDYRFYDIDLVHPNYMATDFVLQKFMTSCIDDEARGLMEELKKISIARRHKAFHPGTSAHQQFLSSFAEKTKNLQDKYPFLDLQDELSYFTAP